MKKHRNCKLFTTYVESTVVEHLDRDLSHEWLIHKIPQDMNRFSTFVVFSCTSFQGRRLGNRSAATREMGRAERAKEAAAASGGWQRTQASGTY